jgi:NitT/TauT family transport system permease protein
VNQVPGAQNAVAQVVSEVTPTRPRGLTGASLSVLRQASQLRAVPSLVAFGLGLALWQAITTSGAVPSYVVPQPGRVAAAWMQLMGNGSLWRHVSATLTEATLGFTCAFVAGVTLAYPLARSETLARLTAPFIAATQAMPMVALAPLLVVWFGLGLSSKIIICGLIVFFPILVNSIVGLRSIDRELTDAAKTLGAGRWSCLWFVEIPLSLRPLLGGIRMGLTLAMTGAVVGEFVASDAGLGFLMILSRTNFDAAMLFAASLTMTALSITVYKFISWLEEVLIDW